MSGHRIGGGRLRTEAGETGSRRERSRRLWRRPFRAPQAACGRWRSTGPASAGTVRERRSQPVLQALAGQEFGVRSAGCSTAAFGRRVQKVGSGGRTGTACLMLLWGTAAAMSLSRPVGGGARWTRIGQGCVSPAVPKEAGAACRQGSDGFRGRPRGRMIRKASGVTGPASMHLAPSSFRAPETP